MTELEQAEAELAEAREALREADSRFHLALNRVMVARRV